MKLCLLVASEDTPIKFHQYVSPKYELNKNTTNGYVKVDNSTPEPYMNNSGQLKNAENRGKSSPGRSTPIRHPVSVKWSVLKNILKSNII